MKNTARNVLFALLGGLLMLSFFGCNKDTKNPAEPTSPAVPTATGAAAETAGAVPTESAAASADATLVFRSFDGGGPSFQMEAEDPSALSYRSEKVYNSPKHDQMTGAGYKVIFTLTGLKPGDTAFTITADSPISGKETYRYNAHIDANLNVTVAPADPEATCPFEINS